MIDNVEKYVFKKYIENIIDDLGKFRQNHFNMSILFNIYKIKTKLEYSNTISILKINL